MNFTTPQVKKIASY